MNKLQVFLGSPYTAPAAELHFGDVYIYLVENPSSYSAARMKAYRSTDTYMYFGSGWINNAVREVKDNKFFTVKGLCRPARISTTEGMIDDY